MVVKNANHTSYCWLPLTPTKPEVSLSVIITSKFFQSIFHQGTGSLPRLCMPDAPLSRNQTFPKFFRLFSEALIIRFFTERHAPFCPASIYPFSRTNTALLLRSSVNEPFSNPLHSACTTRKYYFRLSHFLESSEADLGLSWLRCVYGASFSDSAKPQSCYTYWYLYHCTYEQPRL